MNGMSLRWRPLNATDRSKATKVTPQMTPDIWWNEFLFANKRAWNVEVDWDEFVAPTAVHSIVGSIHFRHISTGTWFTRAVKDLIEVRGDISVNIRYHGAIYLTRWSKKVWRILYQKLQLKHCRSYVSFMFMIYFQDSFSYACFSCMHNIQTFFFYEIQAVCALCSISVITISYCSYFLSKRFKICLIISYWYPCILHCCRLQHDIVLNLSFTNAMMLLTIWYLYHYVSRKQVSRDM